MIEQYWNEVFGKYKTLTGKFEIPGFPEPLMSAHYGVTNLIGEGEGKKFYLCEFEPVNSDVVNISSEKLSDVGLEFWSYQWKYNSSAFPFVQRLVPFLTQLNTPHYHLYMKDEKGICASSIIGVGQSTGFLFNLSVREDKRGQGLAKSMTDETRSFVKGKNCFYWTVHEGFFFDSKVSDYYLCL
jgi:ribosomal protein S18 acetylase RimI-like enzyme